MVAERCRLPASLRRSGADCDNHRDVTTHYPPAREADVVDDYHGRLIKDPFRWMEDLESPELAEWIASQNSVTADYLASLPGRDRFRNRITELWNYPKVSLPTVEAGTLFYQKNTGLQKQAPIYVRDGIDAAPRSSSSIRTSCPRTDRPRSWRSPHLPTPACSHTRWRRAAPTGRRSTCAIWKPAVTSDDRVRWMRFSELAWTNDSRGFFYSRFPEPPPGKVSRRRCPVTPSTTTASARRRPRIVLIYERPDLPTWFICGTVTEDGRYLLISLFEGATNNNRLYYADLGDPRSAGRWRARPRDRRDGRRGVCAGRQRRKRRVRAHGCRGRRIAKCIAIDLDHPDAGAWQTIVPEHQATLGVVARDRRPHRRANTWSTCRAALAMFDLPTAGRSAAFALPGAGVDCRPRRTRTTAGSPG